MKVTIKDIAKEAGVSITTVSFVLNGNYKMVSEKTKVKVLEVVKKHNYSQNATAVNLVKRNTKTIGLIVPHIENTFFSSMASDFEKYFAEYGYNIILCNSNDNAEKLEKNKEILKRNRVDALLIVPSAETFTEETHKKKLQKIINAVNFPVCILDRCLEGVKCLQVTFNLKVGSYNATKYLLEQGHRKIACITGPLAIQTANLRFEGYKQAMKEFGAPIKPEYIKTGNFHFESGYNSMFELLKTDITACFALNDLMALGAMKAINESKLSVPENISLISYDDTFFMQFATVALTSVRQNTAELASVTTKIILDRLNNGSDLTPSTVEILPELVIRNSVKALTD